MRIAAALAALFAVTATVHAQDVPALSRAPAPEVVVQRFVDAANARNADAMAALVSPDAEFARFPDGQIVARSRDGIRAFYARLLASLPAAFRITVPSRIVEGQLVIDQEHFAGMSDNRRQATWMYLVRDGLIQRAWVLDGSISTPSDPSRRDSTSSPGDIDGSDHPARLARTS